MEQWQKIIGAVESHEAFIDFGETRYSLEQSIDAVPEAQVQELFDGLVRILRGRLDAAASGLEKELAKLVFRQLFGVRYSTMLIASAEVQCYLDQTMSSHQVQDAESKYASVIVSEALQWHAESVLSHVLIYFRHESKEELKHESAYMTTNSEDCASRDADFSKFIQGLRLYVREYGSTVRSKQHLRVAVLPSSPDASSTLDQNLRTTHLNTCKMLCTKSDDSLILPKTDSKGDDDRYRDLVSTHLGRLLGLTGRPAFIHFSAGSDDILDAEARATAHLYVVFRNGVVPAVALDYKFAMREALNRLAISFALSRLTIAVKEKEQIRKAEEAQYRLFESSIDDLREGMIDLQRRADDIMSVVSTGVWQSFCRWIPTVRRLADVSGVDVHLTWNKSRKPILVQSDHEHWQDEQWAMALLKLVNARPEDFVDVAFSEATPSAVTVWLRLCDSVRKKADKRQNVHMIWRTLDRVGLLNVRAETDGLKKSIEHSGIMDLLSLKFGVYRPDQQTKVFENNGFTALSVVFGIGFTLEHLTASELDPADTFYLPKTLRVPTIMNGLNKLMDERCDKQFVGPVGRTRVRLQRTNCLSIGIAKPEGRAKPFEFRSLVERMKTIKDEHPQQPPVSIGNLSMAVFAALGVDRDNWLRDLSAVKIFDDRIEFRSPCGDTPAICVLNDDFLTFAYGVEDNSQSEAF